VARPFPISFGRQRLLCLGLADSPSMSTSTPRSYVPRVAVGEDAVPTRGEIPLPDSEFSKFADALKTSPDVLPPMFVCTSRLCLSGPGFKTISVRQADCLELQERFDSVFPIRSIDRLAQKQTWDLRNMRFVLKNDEDEELFYVELATDLSEFDVYGPYERRYGTYKLPVECRSILSQFSRVRSPVKPPSCSVEPAVKFEGQNVVYALPSLLGEVAVRFFSNALRAHVLPHAALPNNVSRPLALNGVFCSAVTGRSRSVHKTRINFVVHSTSCECFCRAWRECPRAYRPISPKAERVSVCMEFCGCVMGSGMKSCAFHGDEHMHESANGRWICTGGMNLSMRCKHGPSRNECTTVALPVKYSFVHDLAASSIDLCQECDSAEDDTAERTFRKLDDSHRNFQRCFQDELSSSLITEEDLKRRDQVVVAMLCEGNYCFGKKPRSRSDPCLFLRDGAKNKLDRELVSAVRSHSHLLPPV
jgi:hypothetical protein